MKRRHFLAMALLLASTTVFLGALTALADTPCDTFHLGQELLIPDTWHIVEETQDAQGNVVEKGTEGSYANATFSHPLDVVKSTITLQQFSDRNGRVLTAMLDPAAIEETALSTVETLGLGSSDSVLHFDYWCSGNPIKGVRLTGVYKGEPWIMVLSYFPSTDDRVVLNMYRAPADGSVDTQWFTDVLLARFPELEKVGLGTKPAPADASAQAPAPTATPRPDIAALGDPQVAALTPPELGAFFAEDWAKTYLRLAETSGLALSPVMAWAKDCGLGEAAVAKDGTLSFAVAKASQEVWGGLKKVAVPVAADAWLDRKGFMISPEGMRAVAMGLADAWQGEAVAATPMPTEFGAQCAQDAAAAYLKLGEAYGLPLAPLTQWLKPQGLEQPVVSKDGILTFAVNAKKRDAWGGAKKVEIPTPAEAWLDRKSLRISADGLRQVASTLAQAWMEPSEQPSDSGKSEGVQMKTPLMTEEEIHQAFPNYEWAYTENTVQAQIEGQNEGYASLNEYTYKLCPGGYYYKNRSSSPQGNYIYGSYVPLEQPFYYNFNEDDSAAGNKTATIAILSQEDKESYERQQPLAATTANSYNGLDMKTLTLVEEDVEIAGRTTTRYHGLLPYYGAGVDLWVDDALGIVLKSAAVHYRYGSITTFETTRLAFDGVTLDNIFDPDPYFIERNEYEEANDTTTPRGRDLIASADSLRKKFPYLHVAYTEGYRWYAQGQEDSRAVTVTLGVNHRSKGGVYTVNTSLSEPNGSGRYWKAGEKEYDWFWMGNPNPEVNPLDEDTRMQFDLYGGLPNIEGDRFADIRLYLEEENTQIAGRSAKRYSGKFSGCPFEVWIDDEHRFVLKSIMMNRDGTMLDSVMEITALTLEDQGFPTPEEARAVLVALEKEAADESVRTQWVKTLESLGTELVAPSTNGQSAEGGEIVTVWNGMLVLSSPQDEDGTKAVKYWDREPVGDVVVPSEVDGLPVIAIAQEALVGCHALTGVSISDGVSAIGPDVFSNCGNMVFATLPEGLTHIGKGAFSFCSSLAEITLPGSVEYIGDLAFAGCHGLTQVAVPNSVTELGSCAFAWCEGLKSVTLPEGLTRLSDQLFDGCTQLEQVKIPDGVTYIGTRAFTNCVALTDITIPKGVAYIADDAFEGCGKVKLHVLAGSDAEQYAKNKGLAHTTYDSIQ